MATTPEQQPQSGRRAPGPATPRVTPGGDPAAAEQSALWDGIEYTEFGPADPRRSERRRQTATKDPRRVTAMSHPLRFALARALHSRDRARVVDLARAVGAPANSVSFHLRKLEEAGLVRRAEPGDGDGRATWWETVVPDGERIDEEGLRETEEGAAAFDAVISAMRADLVAMVERFFSDEALHGQRDGAAGNVDVQLRLTFAERRQLGQELRDLLDAWSDRTRGRRDADDLTAYRIMMLMGEERFLG